MPALLLGLATVLAAGALPVPGGKASAEGKEVRRSVQAYGKHPRQQVTAHWRPERTRRPGLVILHGGHWARKTDWGDWARAFATAGYAVFEVDYRLNSDATYPAQRDDVLSALRWIRGHADAYALNPARIAVLGSSAGGHLATAAATHGSGARRAAGVVALSPVASPYRAWQDGGAASASPTQAYLRLNAELLAGCSPGSLRQWTPSCRRVWRSLSVKNDASGADDAPMLLLHSDADFVPAVHSLELAAAERRRGMPRRNVRVKVVPGDAHGMELLAEPGVLEEIADWLRWRTRP